MSHTCKRSTRSPLLPNLKGNSFPSVGVGLLVGTLTGLTTADDDFFFSFTGLVGGWVAFCGLPACTGSLVLSGFFFGTLVALLGFVCLLVCCCDSFESTQIANALNAMTPNPNRPYATRFLFLMHWNNRFLKRQSTQLSSNEPDKSASTSSECLFIFYMYLC